ncbi:hypothetical protein [uncultured Haemophilus sp.]|uniref:hypothetical protein n=1 Tax=uncultured Haemophilus sp. TaxID=237779 RepID=UPI0025DFADB2|nr:hypothetical protein [uncultured Haemophilus sp.]
MSKKKSSDYLHQAFKNLAKAQEEFQKETKDTLRRHEKTLVSHGQEIAKLEKEIMNMRNVAIKAQLDAGVPNKEVALNFGLTPARVSQINKSH